ncbi:hypothetical protein CLV62_11811 [Dysgonomonas alginatilytica]|uniref:Uncharacterized protein n=1 Tax=Dysgonomonas alginatilytica TaxID=1605892 RepID=A0A2V3PNP8_9BACT|nr:hypothetical protein [Dysgonomonas alginatilytica]PXV62624.1 hypothetical protein CLV62_11811 [Dysgonomonas alginatilytica]
MAINKYAQELLEKQQKAERDKWDIENPNGSSTPFSPTTKTIEDLYKINPNAEKEITDSFVIARKAYDKGIADLLKNLTDKYQDYAKQRLEIEKEFNKDIDFLNAQRLNAQTDAEKEVIARSLAKATSDKGKALMSFDFARLKESPEYVRAFEDLKNTSTETLNSLLSQLDEAKQTAASVLSPDQLREYTSTIQSIIDELVDRNPYKALSDSRKELSKAAIELANAEKQLRIIQEGGKVSKLIVENGKLVTTYITEEEAVLKVNEAKDKYTKKNTDVIKSQKKIFDQVNELSKALTDLGSNMGGTSGHIISLMGNVTSFMTTSMEGISKVAQTGAHAISAIEKASVILAIISAAIMLMKELDSLLPDAHEKYEKYAAKIQQINDLEQAVRDYEVAVLKAKQAEKSWFGQDSLQSLKQAKELQQEIVKSKDEINKQAQATYQNESGGGWATSWAKTALQVSKIGQLDKLLGTGLLDGNYEKGTSAAIENLKIETRKKSSGLFGSGIGGKSQKTEDLRTWVKNNLGFDLFDADGWINEEAYEVVMSKYGDKLVGQTKATLEAMAEYKKQYDEYIEQLHEYVSSMYEPLVDNMVDSLWDWLDSGKDALDSFKDYASATFRDIVTDMLKTIVLNDVVGDYKDTVAKLYEDYSAGKITEQELMDGITKQTKDLQNRYETALPGLQMFLDGVNKSLESVTGIDIKDQQDKTSQQASKGGYETMSQDTGTAIEGLQRSTQMSVLNIEGYILTLIGIHTDSNSILRSFSANFQELRNIGLDIMYNIQDIKKNTNELYEINSEIKGMSRKLDSL